MKYYNYRRFLVNIFSSLTNATGWILRGYLIDIRFSNKKNYIS